MSERETERAGTREEAGSTEEVDRPQEHRPEDRGGEWNARRRVAIAFALLILTSLAFAATHVANRPPTRPLLWDESVYISQVTPGMHGVYFSAWHARGITLIIAPVTLLGGWIEAIRIYLTVLSALGTIAIFGLWVRLVDIGATMAAAAFSFSWVTLVSASQVMPNYWAALLGVAATAMFARWIQEGRLPQILSSAGLLAGMALIRPTEASLLTAGLTAYVLLFRRGAWRGAVFLCLGLAVGWGPWVVEMSIRFGGLTGAIREARKGEHFQLIDVTDNVVEHLTFAGGKEATGPTAGAIWWGVVLALSLLAIVQSRSKERSAALIGSLGSLFLAVPYLLFVPAFTPRFLLPAYALSTIPAGIGLRSLLRGGLPLRILGVAVALLFVPWVIWQAGVVGRGSPEATYLTVTTARVGAPMRSLSEGRPCYFLTPRLYPLIALASRCQGTRHRGVPTLVDLERFARRGRELFVVVVGRVRMRERKLRSVASPIVIPETGGWRLYHIPPGTLGPASAT